MLIHLSYPSIPFAHTYVNMGIVVSNLRACKAIIEFEFLLRSHVAIPTSILNEEMTLGRPEFTQHAIEGFR